MVKSLPKSVGFVSKLLVEHLQQPPGFTHIALNSIVILDPPRSSKALKVLGLSHHQANTSHLKHQPLQQQRFGTSIRTNGEKLLILLSQAPEN